MNLLIPPNSSRALSGWLSLRRLTPVLLSLTLLACANQPPTPDWQLNAKAASDRFTQTYLSGQARLPALAFDKARLDVSSTGRLDWLARLELLRCAVQVASLDFTACTGFEALRSDASAADRAYADYLAGQLAPQDVGLVPQAQRDLATATIASQGAVLQAMDAPLSRLVGAAVLLRTGQASPAVLQQAVDTASAQGWRRPLLAWLGAQVSRAEQAGDAPEAARLRRRITLTGTAGLTPATPAPQAAAASGAP